MTSRQPPKNDPVEEQARFECMRFIAEGAFDSWTVFIQREAGQPWSKIRDAARRKQQQEVAEVGVAKAIDPACEYWRQPTNSVTKRAIMTPSGSARIISCTEPSCRSVLGEWTKPMRNQRPVEVFVLGRRVRYRRRQVVKRITARMPWSRLLKNPIPSRQVESDRNRPGNLPSRLVPH